MRLIPYSRAVITCLALAAAFSGTAAVRADDRPALSLADILARYRQATAPAPGQPALRTRRTTGITEYGGLHGSFVSIEKFPDDTWEEDKLGIMDEFSGSNGKVSWQRDSNGNVRLESLEEQKDDRTDTAITNHTFADASTFPGKVVLRPQTERKTGCYVLEISPADGKPTTLYLDPKTFLIVKKESLDDNRLTTTTYSDFRMLGGFMRASTKRIHSGSRKFDYVSTITSVDPNVDAPDTLFALPAAVNNYKWAKPGATSATIPFDYSDKSVALYCAINGRPAYLELDSGASGVALAQYAADTLHLAHAGTFEAFGYGGSVNEYPVKLDSFELVDGVVFSGLSATTLPLFDDYYSYEAVPVMGLIGYDLLSRFVVRINYATQELTLIDPKTFQPAPADGQPLELDLNDNTPSVLASFDGLPPARFLVDTGDSGSTVMLYGPYVAANQIAQKYPHGLDGGGAGVGGEFKTRRVRGHSFAVGGLTLTGIPVELSLDTKGAGASRVLAGALGTDFLSHFTVTFDYSRSRAYFAANADTRKPFDTRSFGIYVVEVPDDNFAHKTQFLLFMDDKSPALSAGLRDRSVLLKIDGKDAQALGLGEVRRLLSIDGGKDSHDLSIIGPDGGTGTVNVKLYDPLPPADAR